MGIITIARTADIFSVARPLRRADLRGEVGERGAGLGRVARVARVARLGVEGAFLDLEVADFFLGEQGIV